MSDPTHDETAGSVEDFDAFWDARDRKGVRVKIMGQVVTLPPSLPLQFELEARKLARSKKDQDVQKLVGILFGADAMTTWAEAGMDLEQFSVLLAWAPRRIAGVAITLAEVAQEIADAQAKGTEGDADPS